MTDHDAEIWRALSEQRTAALVERWGREVPHRFAAARWTGVDHRLREVWDPSTPAGLVLAGPVGTGKTWALWAALRARSEAGRDWMAIRWPEYLQALRPGAEPSGLAARAATVELLAVDELGAGQLTGWGAEQLEHLMDARWRAGAQTIATTNLGIERTGELAEWAGVRVWDRLTDGAIRFVLSGASRRGAGQ